MTPDEIRRLADLIAKTFDDTTIFDTLALSTEPTTTLVSQLRNLATQRGGEPSPDRPDADPAIPGQYPIRVGSDEPTWVSDRDSLSRRLWEAARDLNEDQIDEVLQYIARRFHPAGQPPSFSEWLESQGGIKYEKRVR